MFLLITPHGDWEPATPACATPTTATHYPSWGLGTLIRSRESTLRAAHYPSWGLGTSESRRRVGGERRAHYPSWGLGTELPDWDSVSAVLSLPLMGIGNLMPPDRMMTSLSLITPHGDWEHSCYALRRRVCHPHYPSWGLGTTVSRTANTVEVASLPLMGIGNPRFPAFPPPLSENSLPLMGIGNEPRRVSAVHHVQAHYPSWGLGTP